MADDASDVAQVEGGIVDSVSDAAVSVWVVEVVVKIPSEVG